MCRHFYERISFSLFYLSLISDRLCRSLFEIVLFFYNSQLKEICHG
nr:MAG TPA: hypothetical protein [Caudoviricetes sp.]